MEVYRSRNIRNFLIHLLFLAAGFFKDKAFRKGLANAYIFQESIALSETERLENNSERWKKR